MSKPNIIIDIERGGTIKEIEGKDDLLLINTTLEYLVLSADHSKALIRIDGKKDLLVKTDILANKSKLTELLFPYSCFASGQDLEWLKMALFAQYEEKKKVLNQPLLLVDCSNYCGRYTDENADFWILFNKILIKKGNEWETIKYEGTTNLDINGVTYYINTTKLDSALLIQSDGAEENSELSFEELLDYWQRQYGCTQLLYAVLGYFAATMYMPEVMESSHEGFFPLMVLFGTTAQGKTSLIQSLYRFWGVHAVPTDYTQVSPFVETKQVCSVGGFPIWRDEYRQTGYAPGKESILRSLYTRSTLNKGTSSQELISYIPKTTVLLSGEDTVTDAALRRRFVAFTLSEKYKLNGQEWSKQCVIADKYFSQLFYHFVRRGFNKEVFQKLLKLPLFTQNAEKEEKILYAALGAVTSYEFGEDIIKEGGVFWQSIVDDEPDAATGRQSIVDQFFDFVKTMAHGKGWLKGQAYGQTWKEANILNYLNYKTEFNGSVVYRIYLWGLIKEAFKNGFGKETNLSDKALRMAIGEVIRGENKVIKFNKVAAKGLEFEDGDRLPESLKILMANIQDTMEEEVIALRKIEENSNYLPSWKR